MILVTAEIVMAWYGLVLLFRGKMNMGRHGRTVGLPARIAGLVLLLPIPVAIAGTVVAAFMTILQHGHVDRQSLQAPAIVSEEFAVLSCALAAYAILRLSARPIRSDPVPPPTPTPETEPTK
jgi:hypothetical protein